MDPDGMATHERNFTLLLPSHDKLKFNARQTKTQAILNIQLFASRSIITQLVLLLHHV